MEEIYKKVVEKIIEDSCRENNLERSEFADWLQKQDLEAFKSKLQSEYNWSPQTLASVLFELINTVAGNFDKKADGAQSRIFDSIQGTTGMCRGVLMPTAKENDDQGTRSEMENATEKNKSFIKGNLITGGVASGKTTILAYEIKNFVRWNEDWSLLAVGGIELFSKLPNEIKENPAHNLLSVNFLAFSEIKPAADNFMRILAEAIAEDKTLLIAVDEPAHFFADGNVRSRFTRIIERANVNQRRQIHLLMTYHQISVCEALFGAAFAQNFGIYTVLQNPRTDEFFRQFGLDSRTVKRGEGHHLQKNVESGGYEFPPVYSASNPIIKFKPGDMESIKYAPKPELPNVFSIIAGLFRKLRNFAQLKISH